MLFHLLLRKRMSVTDVALTYDFTRFRCKHDGSTDRWMDGWTIGQKDEWTLSHRLAHQFFHLSYEWWTDWWMDGRTDRRMDGWIDWQIDRWTNCQNYGRTQGQIYGSSFCIARTRKDDFMYLIFWKTFFCFLRVWRTDGPTDGPTEKNLRIFFKIQNMVKQGPEDQRCVLLFDGMIVSWHDSWHALNGFV